MAESAVESTSVPIKVPEPEQHGPPTLAEPASGPVAEMSGALAQEKTGATPAANDAPTTANGATEPTTSDTQPVSASDKVAEPTSQPAAEVSQATNEDEMKDTQDSTAVDDGALPAANGTPADKKVQNGKRKSMGGVPEHKGKKLSKKKSVAKITHLDAQPGEYYFARLKSYPPWPSMICDEDMLPTTLLNTRPMTTKKSDGTYNEAYDDGGKKVMDRTFPIMFLYTNEFAWIPNTDLTPLNPADLKDAVEKGKSKSLFAAYQVAAEGHDIQYFKDMLMDHARALQEDEDRKEAKEAEKAAKAEKKTKRKSSGKAADADVEMEDAEAEPAPKKSSKKRKKDAESDDEQPEKPAKTPKTTKLKLTTNKTPATTEKKVPEPKSTKKSAKKAKEAVSDVEMADVEEKPEEKIVDPVEERKAREKEVLFLRHKLQKGFLSRESPPQESEMPAMSNYIKKLEAYEDLEVTIIRFTKINKVLKALNKLNTIPRDEEFQFRKRSVELLKKWNKILGADPTDGDAGDKDAKASPTANGVHEDKSGEENDDKKPQSDEAKDTTAEAEPHTEKDSEVSAATETKDESTPSVAKEAEPKSSGSDEVSKSEAPAVVEKAPESAAAAAEITEEVKATE